ncbi:MAG: CDP-glycerol glycerophosphotransferase family protein [Bifidobacteriaceae bacterium]|jgi:hypothetical protein|nr:CDP-glycerol glycerophosphotransferase family protein [Bifidobacteriaceae bacterium]
MSRLSFWPDVPLRSIVWALELPLALLNGLALAALAVAWAGGPAPLVVAMAAVACLGAGAMGTRRARAAQQPLAGNYVLSRLASLCAVFSFSLPDAVWPRLAAVAAVAGCLLAEPIARAFAAQAFPYAAGFAGVRTRLSHLPADIIFWANSAAALALVLAGDQALAAQLGLALAVAAADLVVLADVAWFAIGRLRFNARLPKLWAAMGPAFAVHWQAARGSIHQLTMWMDHLKALGKPFFIITRTRENFAEVTQAFDLPVLHRVGLDAVEDALSESLKTVFYVNTAILNDHLLRYPHLNHIQLNHGDSDKIASYSPVFRAYDKDFVAGQAAVDRFAAAGLATAPDFFVIVGRPQVAGVAASRGPLAGLEAPVALYAPTWTGNTKDSDYTSLRRGPQIVQALLDRGCSVVFRPHPYWDKHHATAAARAAVVALLARDAAATGRDHVFGARAEAEWSVFDCFNRSDLMISDVSSVVNDYLYSEKPFVMMAVTAGPDEFADEYPVARGAYVVDYATIADPAPPGGQGWPYGPAAPGEAGGPAAASGRAVPPPGGQTLAAALDLIWDGDPLAPVRRELKTYYLGDIPRDEYASRFGQEAAKYV